MIAEIANRIAAEYIPYPEELTTSDLQGCVGAAVALAGLFGDEALECENLVLELVYEAQRKAAGDE